VGARRLSRTVPYPSAHPSAMPISIGPYRYYDTRYQICWLTPSRARTSYSCTTTVHVDGSDGYVSISNGVTVDNVAVVMRNILLTPYTILIELKQTNVNSATEYCGIALDADMYTTGNSHSVNVIGCGEGVYWYDYTYTVNVIGSSSYPLTTGLSTYWYGDFVLASSNRWTQPTSSSTDYVFAMWWHNISVPGSGSNGTSFLFRSGLHYREQPTVSVTAQASTVLVSGTFPIELLPSDPIPTQMLYVFWLLIRMFIVSVVLEMV
jgi:hypothetical protein